ncbi:chloride channel protein [uncultured Dysosmobacter sp.]|uniref:chloride channel protein n=1 Tax=uncultured Dysosmobacter sp. TaxID=2591384 RepID=UPI0026719C74|nr:chloride channel protein [uncultured Dysosmobacter sp.]
MDTKAIRTALRRWGLYVRTFIKWTAAAAVIGAACGLVGTLFHFGVHEVTAFRGTHPWVLYLLPLAGLVIVGFYKLTGTDGLGTDDIIDAVHQGKLLPILLLPAIFFGTILTHLCGGSAGREGAALQMGGTIGQYLGRHFQLDDRDLRVATLAGMAAFFSALFGTPLAATVFAIMVISIGVIYHVALYPSLLAALVAYGVSIHLGVEPTRFAVSVPEQTVGMFVRVALLGVLCALVSILFCQVMHGAGHLMKRIRNPWLRVVCGGAAIIVLTLIFGTDYNGAGMEIVTAAVEQGTVAVPWAFLLKLIFTAITLAAGFKGGEVVPSFFVGATFGCAAAPLLGLPAGFGAAVGLAAVFCGVTNCPLASTLLAVELFGAEGLLYFALACCLSYMLSGYQGLYSSQTILYSKLKAQFINVHTNAHHAGEKTE